MNKKIEELIKQADEKFNCEYNGTYTVFNREKFAELIIQECAKVGADFVPGYGLVPFSKRFNEHYGVEKMNEQNEDEVSYSIPFVCIAVILVLTFMMVVSK